MQAAVAAVAARPTGPHVLAAFAITGCSFAVAVEGFSVRDILRWKIGFYARRVVPHIYHQPVLRQPGHI